jgi:hypothetical protein
VTAVVHGMISVLGCMHDRSGQAAQHSLPFDCNVTSIVRQVLYMMVLALQKAETCPHGVTEQSVLSSQAGGV